MHLSGVGMTEPADLQIDHDERLEASMEEKKIDAVPLVVDPQPPLTTDKCEVVTQLKEKILETMDQRRFKIRFRVFVLQVQELEDIRIFDRFFRLIASDCMACAVASNGAE
jgi:hypothetical protein